MIGYRPDAALTYDLRITVISIFVGIVYVGLPMAAALFFEAPRVRIGLGIAAGLGVTAMHLTGMAALENCTTSYNPVVLGLGILAGVGGFVVALSQTAPGAAGRLQRVAGFVGGVCALHFIAMGSASVMPFVGAINGIGGSFMSILVAVVSLGVLAIAMIATFNYRRTLATLSLSA